MRYRKTLLLGLSSGFFVFFTLFPRVYAADVTSVNGGSNASDYQPPTGNPQSNVQTNLQQNNGSLQPVIGTNGQGQNGLPTVKNLQVISTGQANQNQAPNNPVATKSNSGAWAGLVIGLGIVVGLIYWLTKQGQTKQPPTSPTLSKESTTTEVIKDAPEPKQPKSSKKKKNNQKRRKRKHH